VIINNRIYNDYEDDDYMGLAPPRRERSRSRSRPSPFIARDDYELEKTRRELEAFKPPNTREDHGARTAISGGAASATKPPGPPPKSYHPANDLERPRSRGSIFSDAPYQDLPLDSPATSEIARDREASVDVEGLMDQFLETFVEGGEGDNE
jgi:hypothetical protein